MGSTESDVHTKGVLLKENNLVLLTEDTLDMLLEARADVNSGNHKFGDSKTVLHVAAKLGDAVLTRKVLAAKANLEQVDSKLGFSALHLATRSKHFDVVKILIEARADPRQKAVNGKTSIELANINGVGAETIATLFGTDAKPVVSANTKTPKSIFDFTPEQRAALCLE